MSSNTTRQTIVDTAFALFRKRDYAQVTVNDICEACGITKTTFYYHLQSKDDIVSGFYGAAIADIAERLLDALAADNHWEQLMACFDALLDISAGIGPDLYAQLYIMNLREDKGTFDFDARLSKIAVLLIKRAQGAGQVRNTSPALSLYRAAAHAFEGYELMWCVKKGAFERKRVVRKAFEDLFDVEPELRRSDGVADSLY